MRTPDKDKAAGAVPDDVCNRPDTADEEPTEIVSSMRLAEQGQHIVHLGPVETDSPAPSPLRQQVTDLARRRWLAVAAFVIGWLLLLSALAL